MPNANDKTKWNEAYKLLRKARDIIEEIEYGGKAMNDLEDVIGHVYRTKVKA